MDQSIEIELLTLNQRLLESIAAGNWTLMPISAIPS